MTFKTKFGSFYNRKIKLMLISKKIKNRLNIYCNIIKKKNNVLKEVKL